MRLRTNIQQLLVYATFISLSVALHMIVILGTAPSADPQSGTAAVDSSAAVSSRVERSR